MDHKPSDLLRLLCSGNACLAIATLVLAVAGAPRPALAEGYPPLFATFGDIPYDTPVDNYPTRNGKYPDRVNELDREVSARFIFPTLKNRADIPFLIHAGDTGRPEVACQAEHFDKTVSSWEQLAQAPLPKPVFYTPGDNDWTDCERAGIGIDPLSALRLIRDVAFDGWQLSRAAGVGDWRAVVGLHMLNRKAMPYDHRDGANFARYPENWMWRYQSGIDNVVFATVHEVGSENGWVKTGDPGWQRRQEEVKSRVANNLQWISQALDYATRRRANAVVIAMHADPFEDPPRQGSCKASYTTICRRLQDIAETLERHSPPVPVLLVHADTNRHCLDQPWTNVWRLNAPGDFKVIDADVVTFRPGNANAPFEVTGLLSGLSPPAVCSAIPDDGKDPTLAANRLGALVLHDRNGDCGNSDISGDGDPAKIGGFVSVNKINAKNGSSYYSILVNINRGTPDTAYLFNLKCHNYLGTVMTNHAGFGSNSFTVGVDVGNSFSFDMYPDGQPSGNTYQAEQINY